jgi:DNA-binding NtrC family response regulator
MARTSTEKPMAVALFATFFPVGIVGAYLLPRMDDIKLGCTSPHEGPSVLVLDDEDEARQFYVAGLIQEGLSCIPARSAEEALAALATNRVSLAVLDWDLGTGTSRPVLREAKKNHPLIPVLVMSGKLYDVRTDALLAHADAFLLKPFCMTVLQHQARQLLKLSQSARRHLFPETPEDIRPFSEMKQMYIRQAVQLLNGNVSLAAQRLGLHRHTVAAALKPAWSVDNILASQPSEA